MERLNEFGQPVGEDLDGWEPRPFPAPKPTVGRHVMLMPLDRAEHGQPIFDIFESASASLWTYMHFGPFDNADLVGELIDDLNALDDWQPYAIVVAGRSVGFLSFLRIDEVGGVAEIGSIAFAPELQRTTAATEALYLMIKMVFEAGYRRCEWKCDDLNGPSRAAALRLGFRYEGTFRKATHYKGRSRDTAWFAITDDEWPALNNAFITWLSPTNFDDGGRQRRALSGLRGGAPD